MAFLRSDVAKARRQVVLTVAHHDTTSTYSFDRQTPLAAVLERISVDLGVGPRSIIMKACLRPDAQTLQRF